MIGSFGDIAFETSADKLRTFRDMSKQHKARYAKHQVIGKKPVLEFIGADTKTVTMNIRLDVTKGVIPQSEIDKLEEIKDSGESQALTLGTKYHGMFVLKEFTEANKIYDNKGGLWIADVSLNLEEDADE